MGNREPDLPAIRASDGDRDRTIRALRDRSIEGRISHDTFMTRLDQALQARNREELDELVRDLPPSGRLSRLTNAVSGLSELVGRVQNAWRAPRLPRLPLPADDRRRLTIGRAPDCDLLLGDPMVSRHHAELQRIGSEWLLIDLGSSNGTRLNGWRVVEPVVVRLGDQVSFGRISFLVARSAS
jgi:FHA domain/Domain of unknown function (DUF1707)